MRVENIQLCSVQWSWDWVKCSTHVNDALRCRQIVSLIRSNVKKNNSNYEQKLAQYSYKYITFRRSYVSSSSLYCPNGHDAVGLILDLNSFNTFTLVDVFFSGSRTFIMIVFGVPFGFTMHPVPDDA